MDLLTLMVEAQNNPKRCVVDEGGDAWHAECFVEFLGSCFDPASPGDDQTRAHMIDRSRFVSRMEWEDEPYIRQQCYGAWMAGCKHGRKDYTWTP